MTACKTLKNIIESTKDSTHVVTYSFELSRSYEKQCTRFRAVRSGFHFQELNTLISSRSEVTESRETDIQHNKLFYGFCKHLSENGT